MLIDLSRPVTINPFEYPTMLAILLETDDRPECGVFAGRHDDFARHEEGKIVPLIENAGNGRLTFLLDRPARETREHLVRRWHYAAIGWDNAVYVEYPCAYELVLGEHEYGPDNYHWSISVTAHTPLFHLVLFDYEPGALGRGVVSPLLEA